MGRMMKKILIGLIILFASGAGGFFIYKNISAPEVGVPKVEEEETPVVEEKSEEEEGVSGEQVILSEEKISEDKVENQTEEQAEEQAEEQVEEQAVSPEEKETPKEQAEEQVEEQAVLPEKEEESALVPVQITFLDDLIADPDWNFDGSQIVFCDKGGGAPTLHSINIDGSGLKEIGPGFDPSCSPVEDKIAYELNGQIYTMNSNGGDITQLTTGYSSAQPAWNSDGTKIVYTYYGAAKPSIWTMNADGSGKTQITTSADGECALPSFNHNGSKIVYAKGHVWNTSSERLPTAINEIWIMNLNGSNKHKIYASSDSYQWIFQRAWNKNNEILFMKNPLQDRKIPEMFVINSDGTNPRCMVDPPKDSFGIPISFYLDPVWDNSGIKVVAVRKMIDGPQNIVIISVEE
jgi:Tol biopolymer transport system component